MLCKRLPGRVVYQIPNLDGLASPQGDAAAAPGEALAGARGAQLFGERSASLQAAEGGRWDMASL